MGVIRHVDAGYEIAEETAAARAACASRCARAEWRSLLVDDIGELHDQRPDARATGRRWAAESTRRWWSTSDRVAVGRADAPTPPPPTSASTRDGRRGRARASSTPTRTSSSPASARDEFEARMAGATLRRRRHRAHRGGDARGQRRSSSRAAAARAGGAARRRASRRVEVKSGYDLTVEGEARLLRRSRARLTDEVTFLGAHVVPREYARRPRGVRRAGARGDDRGAARRARAGPTSSVTPAPSTSTRRASCCAPAPRAGLGLRLHANQLGDTGGGRPGGRARTRPAWTTAPT